MLGNNGFMSPFLPAPVVSTPLMLMPRVLQSSYGLTGLLAAVCLRVVPLIFLLLLYMGLLVAEGLPVVLLISLLLLFNIAEEIVRA